MVTGDDNRYVCAFWEAYLGDGTWVPILQAPKQTAFYTARSDMVRWEAGEGSLHNASTAHNFPPTRVLANRGIAVQRVSKLSVTIYDGEVFDDSVSPLLLDDPANLPAVWAFCSSQDFCTEIRRIDRALKVVPGAITKIPFDLAYWQKVAAEKYPTGLPKPYSDDPTQWLCHGHPASSTTPLQVALARLLGYRWPAEEDPDMELSPEARALIERCRDLDELVDDDGIVCIPSVRGEQPAHVRLQALLAKAYGDQWYPGLLESLLKDVGYEGKNLVTWLRDGFFEQHGQLFHHRPFIWHIWDGRRDGFAALVNYHKLDRNKLETLTYTYLGDWIRRQEDELKQNIGGAEARVLAARGLQEKLEDILKGEDPYDIFVRWKPIEKQPIGWEPDLNDGVRLNIRPFVEADVLRKKPKIKWTKDRGKDPEDAPWYPLFQGERINDHHLSLDEKKTARKALAEVP